MPPIPLHLEDQLARRPQNHLSGPAPFPHPLARRLQPHFIASFFQEAFAMLGGQLKGREPKGGRP